MNYSELDESSLVTRFREGDYEAVNEIVRRFRDKLFAFCVKVSGSPEEAADVVQDTFLKMLSIRDRLDEGKSIGAFLFKIAFNICMDRKRKRKHSVSWDDFSWAEQSIPSAEESALLREEKKRSRKVWEAVSELPLSARTLIELRYRSELTPDEIADVLGIPASTVRVRLFRARKLLAEKLKEAPEGRENETF